MPGSRYIVQRQLHEVRWPQKTRGKVDNIGTLSTCETFMALVLRESISSFHRLPAAYSCDGTSCSPLHLQGLAHSSHQINLLLNE